MGTWPDVLQNSLPWDSSAVFSWLAGDDGVWGGAAGSVTLALRHVTATCSRRVPSLAARPRRQRLHGVLRCFGGCHSRIRSSPPEISRLAASGGPGSLRGHRGTGRAYWRPRLWAAFRSALAVSPTVPFCRWAAQRHHGRTDVGGDSAVLSGATALGRCGALGGVTAPAIHHTPTLTCPPAEPAEAESRGRGGPAPRGHSSEAAASRGPPAAGRRPAGTPASPAGPCGATRRCQHLSRKTISLELFPPGEHRWVLLFVLIQQPTPPSLAGPGHLLSLAAWALATGLSAGSCSAHCWQGGQARRRGDVSFPGPRARHQWEWHSRLPGGLLSPCLHL